jgi:hypothetical protein
MLGRSLGERERAAGLALAFSGVVGLWAISFFSIDLQRYIFDKSLTAQGLTGKELAGAKGILRRCYIAGLTAWRLLRHVRLQHHHTLSGPKTYLCVVLVTGCRDDGVGLPTTEYGERYPVDGASDGILSVSVVRRICDLLPELFPTRLRSTGTSFCYNVGRFIAAAGPPMLSYLATVTFVGFKTEAQPELHFRYAGLAMCSVYAIGLIALWFLPETNGKPLPESDTPLDVAPTNFRIVASGVTR